MSESKDVGNFSNQIIDMLVDHTLKKHGAQLDANKLDTKDKERIKDLVESLKQSVDSLTHSNEIEESGQKEEKERD
ncbi:hypothetical protein WMZ97_03545 [Lentibacillus sp. N15]|uniref:hypothetical protein n=1 Tax=Lentibacillus songyuanensis TaxID=3136161 RepID=UPI0031BBA5D4